MDATVNDQFMIRTECLVMANSLIAKTRRVIPNARQYKQGTGQVCDLSSIAKLRR